MPRSACTSAQSDQSLHCQLPESLDTMVCINSKKRLLLRHGHVQDDVNLHILCMLEGTFSLDMCPIYFSVNVLKFRTLYFILFCLNFAFYAVVY